MVKMSSPVRRRPRSRRKINWTPALALILSLNIIIAGFRSGVTAIRSVNLDGVRKSERLRLERMSDSIKGKPALTIDPRLVEAPFMNESRVKSADFRRNIFGIGRLILRYRIPVATIAGAKDTYLDPEGVIFMDPEVAVDPAATKTLPSIALDAQIRVSVMTLAGVINYRSVADLAKLVQSELTSMNKSEVPVEIEVLGTGGVCLNMNNGTAILGTFRQLSEKVQRLKQSFQEHPDLFEVNSSVNLMVPENPQVIARNKENGQSVRKDQ